MIWTRLKKPLGFLYDFDIFPFRKRPSRSEDRWVSRAGVRCLAGAHWPFISVIKGDNGKSIKPRILWEKPKKNPHLDTFGSMIFPIKTFLEGKCAQKPPGLPHFTTKSSGSGWWSGCLACCSHQRRTCRWSPPVYDFMAMGMTGRFHGQLGDFHRLDGDIPSGKHTKNYGKSQSLVGKSTLNGYFQ